MNGAEGVIFHIRRKHFLWILFFMFLANLILLMPHTNLSLLEKIFISMCTFITVFSFWVSSVKIDEKGIYSLCILFNKEIWTIKFMPWEDIAFVQKRGLSSTNFLIIVYPKFFGQLKYRDGLKFHSGYDWKKIVEIISERSKDAVIDPTLRNFS
jgi:hypothetical protein